MVKALDSSRGSEVSAGTSEVSTSSSRNEEQRQVSEKRRSIKALRDRLPAFKRGVSGRWLKHPLSLRRPHGLSPLSSYQIGNRSTRQLLPSHVLEDGMTVPGFECKGLETERIGSGSQAIVYKCGEGDQTVAIKVLRHEMAIHPEEREAFEREVNLLARLAHPHINNVIGIGEMTKLPCAMLEWCSSDVHKALRLRDQGVNPHARAAAVKEWPSVDRIRLAWELASAMRFLHSGRALKNCLVLHRDVKPENVGLCGKTVKMLDFGLAVVLEQDKTDHVKCSTETKAGETMVYDCTKETGTRRYMAPEVSRGESYGSPADVYSFAITCWEMLALLGKPYDGYDMHLFTQLVAKGNDRPAIPAGWDMNLAQLIAASWAKRHEDRPTFDTIYDRLEGILKDAEHQAKQAADYALNPKRHPKPPPDPLALHPPSACGCCLPNAL